MSETKDRLLSFLRYKNMGQQKFEISIGMSNGWVNKVGDNIRETTLQKISEVYPELSIAWLKSGLGAMLLNVESGEALETPSGAEKVNMEKSEMLECVINHYTGGNKARFASMLGVKPQTINTWVARNTFDAELIYSKCKGISGDWLLGNGNGDMLRRSNSLIANGGCYASVGYNNAILSERVKYLEELLSEKERLINVLMNKI